jgi:hypothetical protein
VIEDTGEPLVLIAETEPLSGTGSTEVPVRATPIDPAPRIDRLLDEQKRVALPSLEGHYLRIGMSRVYEEGTEIYVLFSVVNRNKGIWR